MARGDSTRYATLAQLAKGGMGTVAIVRDRERSDGPLFALKRLRPELRDEEAVRTMFLDESRVASLIQHPNVARVVEVGDDDEGPYIVMEYVDGVSLAALIEHHRSTATDVPLDLCVELGRQIATGLAAAHEATTPEGEQLGLVHRDVSPQNIIVGYDGVVRVADFGIAKARGRLSRTSTGLLKGKVGYMAPEQLRFEPTDARSDLFALGVVVYELATGERLYGGELEGGAARRVFDEPAPDLGDMRPSAPPALVELLLDLLAKDPHHRPSDARTVAERFAAIQRQLTGESSGVDDVAAYMLDHLAHLRRRPQDIAEDAARSGSATVQFTASRDAPSTRGSWLRGGVLALLAAGLGGAAWAWWPDSDNASSTETRSTATEPSVGVHGLAVAWATPNTVRWSWQVHGDVANLLRYELRLAGTRDAVAAGDASARVIGPEQNPELAYATLPNTKAGDLVLGTTAEGLTPGTEYYAQLSATDSRGAVARSEIVATRTPLPPNRSLALYSDARGSGRAWPAVHPECLVESEARPHAGAKHYLYRAACDAQGHATCDGGTGETTAGCWENLVWSDLDLELGKFTPGMFDAAYLELAVALDGPRPSFWSELSLRTGTGRWVVSALTLRADGAYQVLQLPLRVFAADDRALELADVVPVRGFEVGGSWSSGSTVRVDEVYLRY